MERRQRCREAACDAAAAGSLASQRTLRGRPFPDLDGFARGLGRALQGFVQTECRGLRPDGSPVPAGALRSALGRLALAGIELEHPRCDGETLAHEILDAVHELERYLDLERESGGAGVALADLPRNGPRRRRIAELAAALHCTAGVTAEGDVAAGDELPALMRRFVEALCAHLPRERAWLRRLERAGGLDSRARRTLETLSRAGRFLERSAMVLQERHDGDPQLPWECMELTHATQAYLDMAERLQAHAAGGPQLQDPRPRGPRLPRAA